MESAGILWLGLLLVVLFSRLIGMTVFPLVETTEPRYAEISRVMAQSGDWITPWFDADMQVPFWGKPPLSFWAQAVSISLFGANEFAARLPSWVATLLTLALIGRLALALGGSLLALGSVVIYSTMVLPYVSAGAVMTDAFLTLGVTLSLVSFGMVINGHAGGWRWAFFLGLAIGLLAKGPLTLVLIGVTLVLWAVTAGRLKRLFRMLPWPSGMLLTLLLSVPWYVAAEMKTPGFLDYFLIGEHVRRFIDPGWSGDLYGRAHHEPWGMIWLFWLGATFPWGAAILYLLLFTFLKERRLPDIGSALRERHTALFLYDSLVPLLFFSFAANILWTYVLPALPMTAILFARYLLPMMQDARNHWLKGVALLVPLTLTLCLSAGEFYGDRLNTEKTITDGYKSAARPDDSPLIYMKEVPFSARFYTLGYARALDPEQIGRMIGGGHYHRVFVAFRHGDAGALVQLREESGEVIARSKKYTLMLYTVRDQAGNRRMSL